MAQALCTGGELRLYFAERGFVSAMQGAKIHAAMQGQSTQAVALVDVAAPPCRYSLSYISKLLSFATPLRMPRASCPRWWRPAPHSRLTSQVKSAIRPTEPA